ncbi:tight junction protein ZO-1 isoform X1 [Tachysurus ichikawai]
MCFQFFGNSMDRTGEEVLVERFRTKMFGRSTMKWYAQRTKKPKNGAKKARCWKKRVVRILKQHRELILNELDVSKVLSCLLYKKVFSLSEYTELLGQESSRKRAELFLDQIMDKGPDAFYSFCSVLEEVSPHLLTCLLLGNEDGSGGQNKKQGQNLPSQTQEDVFSREEGTVCYPPLYTDPLFDTRVLMWRGPSWHLLCLVQKAINHTVPAGEGSGPAFTSGIRL